MADEIKSHFTAPNSCHFSPDCPLHCNNFARKPDIFRFLLAKWPTVLIFTAPSAAATNNERSGGIPCGGLSQAPVLL